MRIVKWSPQERVDAPDLTAMSYLTLGEFRRTTRGILLGAADTSPNYILNGFKVEPQAVPDSTIRVRLDVAGKLSHAFGAELIGARVDYGQLIGGDDSNGNTEGNATQNLDFTGQPTATYTVEMRFVYTDGVIDNRAFWNPTTNSEFISTVQTRTLSGFELRFSGAPSSEWIPLADVAWAGAGAITTGMITDVREFAFEGTAPYFQTTALGSGGIVNFSRSFDRATNGLNAVYPALRGLARQIQDIKGADDGNTWNWFNTPYRPGGVAGATLGFDSATSLRSLRTVHFTVGDGTTSFGDFNGTALAEGLDECLSFIETQDAANLTGHYIIQILANGDDTGDTEWQIGNYDFASCVVEIRGGGGSHSAAGEYRWCSTILCAGTFTTEAFDITPSGGQGGLILRNLRFKDTGSNTELVRLGTQAHFEMHDCIVELQSTSTNPWLEMGSIYHGRIVDSTIQQGVANVTALAFTKVVWSGCKLQNGTIRFVKAGGLYAGGHAFNNCRFSNNSDLGQCVFLSGATDLTFNDCTLSQNSMDHDIVHADTSIGDWYDLSFQGCRFSSFETSPNRLPDAGSNGTLGTGWQLFLDNNGASADTSGRGVTIDNCFFTASGAFTSGVIDSGAIFARELEGISITGCQFYDFDLLTGGAPRCYLVHLVGSALTSPHSAVVSNCSFDRWSTNGPTGTRNCVRIFDHRVTRIIGNLFETPASSTALYVDDGDYSVIANNIFKNGNNTADTCNLIGSSGLVVSSNQFYLCPRSIALTSCAYSALTGNTSIGGSGTAPSLGVFVISSQNTSVTGNVISDFAGTGWDAIYMNANAITVIGNSSQDGNISLNGSTNAVGHNETQDVNNVNAYT